MGIMINKLAASLVAFEEGELNAQEITDLFANLIQSGLAWKLQESYGRIARTMIDAKYISEDGDVLLTWPEDNDHE